MVVLRDKEESLRLVEVARAILSEMGDSLKNQEVVEAAMKRGESFDNACYVSVVYFFG